MEPRVAKCLFEVEELAPVLLESGATLSCVWNCIISRGTSSTKRTSYLSLDVSQADFSTRAKGAVSRMSRKPIENQMRSHTVREM